MSAYYNCGANEKILNTIQYNKDFYLPLLTFELKSAYSAKFRLVINEFKLLKIKF